MHRLPTNRTLTLLLDAGGRLRRLIHGGPQDVEIDVRAGEHIENIAPFTLAERGRQLHWSTVLADLRERTSEVMTYAITIPEQAPGGAHVERMITAIPIADVRGELDAIVIRVGIAREDGSIPAPGEERFRFLAETVPHMLWMARMDGTVEYYSPSWLAFTGKSMEELDHEGYFGSVHPDDQAMLQPERYVERGFQMPTFRVRRHDGVYRWVEVHSTPVFDADGRPLRVVGSTTDVTDRIEAEQHRRALSDQLEAATTLSGLGRFASDRRADTVQIDARAIEILGLPGTPTTSAEFNEMFPPVHPDDRPRLEAAYAELLDGANAEMDAEFRVQRPTSSGGSEERWIFMRLRRQVDEDGAIIGGVGVVGDVTDRRAEQAAMLRSQKREALGTLAGGIAHDFNNVISAILSNAMVAQTEIAAGLSPDESLSEIQRGAERAADIVRRLLGFSREAPREESLFEVAAVAREACSLLRPTVPAGVTIAPPMGVAPAVLGSSSELHQVLVNLVTNAADAAADGGGTVRVEVDAVDREVAISALTPGDPLAQLPPGRYIRVRVTDDGPGIADDVLPRIFDPFFTTKDAGKGTGLGLAAALSIVRGHGGELSAANLPGRRGAAFTMLLPVATAGPSQTHPTPDQDAAGPASPLPTRSADAPRVLFVDDDATIARLAERALPLHGCRVLVFTRPEEALAALANPSQQFDVVVTDLAMPGMNGLELAAAVQATSPLTPVILSSGYLTPENRAQAIASGVVEIIPKPCSMEELAVAARRLSRAAASRD